MSLKKADFQEVSGALRELYSHTDIASLPECVVRLLHRLIPANSAAYNSFDFRTGEMQVYHDHGPEGDRYLPALNEHIQSHPLLEHLRTHWRDGAASLADVISDRRLRDNPIYCEFLRPLRIQRQLGVLVEDQGFGFAAIGLQRDGREFSARDKQILTLFQPHIIQAFKNASDISRLSTQAANSIEALRIAEVGIVRITSALKISWVSECARKWLTAYFQDGGERISHGELPQKLAEHLRRQSRRAENRTGGQVWEIWTARGVLSVRQVPGFNQEAHLLLAERRHDTGPHDFESLGLTRRESEVLHWITEGKTNELISRILATSRRTVDKQVENILRKLGVESRVAAALRADRFRRRL